MRLIIKEENLPIVTSGSIRCACLWFFHIKNDVAFAVPALDVVGASCSRARGHRWWWLGDGLGGLLDFHPIPRLPTFQDTCFFSHLDHKRLNPRCPPIMTRSTQHALPYRSFSIISAINDPDRPRFKTRDIDYQQILPGVVIDSRNTWITQDKNKGQACCYAMGNCVRYIVSPIYHFFLTFYILPPPETCKVLPVKFVLSHFSHLCSSPPFFWKFEIVSTIVE